MKSLTKNLLLLTATLLIIGLILEAGVRLTIGDSIVLFPRYHTSAQYGDWQIRRLRPDSEFLHTSLDGQWRFTTNSRGFRESREYSYDKPDNTFRVFVMGDSHTQGFEVRQAHTYARIIERSLTKQGITAEVINTGISGFSTAEALVLLENEGIRYQPDVVVLGFYANDFDDNIRSNLFSLTDEELVVNKKTYLPGVRILDIMNAIPPLRWLSEHSYAYSFVLNAGWNLGKQLLLSKEKAALQQEKAVTMEEADQHAQNLTLALLERMYRFCEQNDMQLVLLDIPRQAHETDTSQFNSSLPDFAEQPPAHIVINSEDVLSQYRGIAELFLPNGHRHISEFSHTLLGVAVANQLKP